MVFPAGPLGRFFKDFMVGDVHPFPLGRTVMESDNTWYTLLTMTTNIGRTDIELVHPLYVEDAVYTESLVAAVRPSAPRPSGGIVRVLTWGLNQDGVEFLRFRRSFLIRGSAHQINTFPVPRKPLASEQGVGTRG